MKADINFINHDQEAVEQAEKLGMPEPKPTEWKGEVFFDMSYISIAYVNDDGAIVIYLSSGPWILEYNQELWEKIKKHLNEQ